jgi:hypothetical protein
VGKGGRRRRREEAGRGGGSGRVMFLRIEFQGKKEAL